MCTQNRHDAHVRGIVTIVESVLFVKRPPPSEHHSASIDCSLPNFLGRFYGRALDAYVFFLRTLSNEPSLEQGLKRSHIWLEPLLSSPRWAFRPCSQGLSTFFGFSAPLAGELKPFGFLICTSKSMGNTSGQTVGRSGPMDVNEFVIRTSSSGSGTE